MYKTQTHTDPQENYQALYAATSSHMESEPDLIANLANISAFLYTSLPDINWAGFYVLKGGELVLGPFGGKPACTRIAMGRGVCGTAATDRRVIVVPDVDAFEGHIACDCQTKSEIVLPLYINGEVFGVLDIDSPVLDRFSELDVDYLTKIAECISNHLHKLN
ncbi:MAG: GAF domain-containing protein [Defluviitaleaceae bacterium]|nr:GAF domain-containing protein [Defluviitaleaceae bacterium]